MTEQNDLVEHLQAELETWKATQHYSYIGKDGKPRLARDMEDELSATKDKLAKAVEALEKLNRRGDALETFDIVVHEVVNTALAEIKDHADD